MTDERLREAERAFRESGGVAEEARLLAELVRAGLLAPQRLDLAAELGHEAALLASGLAAPPVTHSLRRVMEGLARFGPETIVRAALVVARRCHALRPDQGETETFLAAIEEWAACPCDRHVAALFKFAGARVHPDARLAFDAVLRSRSFAERHPAGESLSERNAHVPDAGLVLAVRRELVRWALAPHSPRPRERVTRGTLLDLRVGWTDASRTTRLLVSADRIRVGTADGCGIHLVECARGHCELVREGMGFRTQPTGDEAVFLNDSRLDSAELATGDVLGLGQIWVEVRLLSEPFEPDVAEARRDADRLLARGAESRARIEAAAAAGHLGGTLAATGAGIPLRPRFLIDEWSRSLGTVAREAATAANRRLALEVGRLHPDTFRPGDELGRALALLEALGPAPETAARAKLARALEALRPSLPSEYEPRGEDVAKALLGEVLWLAANGLHGLLKTTSLAVRAGLGDERTRALVEEELVRWAFAD